MSELDELFSGNLENVDIVRRDASEREQDIIDRTEKPINPEPSLGNDVSTSAGDIEYFDWKQILKGMVTMRFRLLRDTKRLSLGEKIVTLII
jgi:hypothetical protein